MGRGEPGVVVSEAEMQLALSVETEGSLGVEVDSEAKFPLTSNETMTVQLQPKIMAPLHSETDRIE